MSTAAVTRPDTTPPAIRTLSFDNRVTVYPVRTVINAPILR